MGLGWFLALFCITTITANTAPKFFYTQKHFLPSLTLTQWLLRSQHSKGHRLIPLSHGTGNVPRVIFLTKLPNWPSRRLTKINKSKGQLQCSQQWVLSGFVPIFVQPSPSLSGHPHLCPTGPPTSSGVRLTKILIELVVQSSKTYFS